MMENLNKDKSTIIEVDDLSKSYASLPVLKRLSCSFSQGAIGLLGPNGSGKSTFIKCLLGLVSFQAKKVEILGKDVRKARSSIRRSIGYMPEDPCLIPHLSGIEAIIYMARLSGLSRSQAMSSAHRVCDRIGLAEERYRTSTTYSVGMQQKLKLAQAMVHDPALLILDEPTNGLDPQARLHVSKLIRYLADEAQKTIILSTHILSDVESTCSSVLILSQGQCLVQGRMEDLTKVQYDAVWVRVNPEQRSRYREKLIASGYKVEENRDGDIKVQGPDLPKALFHLAQALPCSIRHLSSPKHTLESIFLRAVKQKDDPDELFLEK